MTSIVNIIINFNKNCHILVPHTKENCTITTRGDENFPLWCLEIQQWHLPEFWQDSHLREAKENSAYSREPPIYFDPIPRAV